MFLSRSAIYLRCSRLETLQQDMFPQISRYMYWYAAFNGNSTFASWNSFATAPLCNHQDGSCLKFNMFVTSWMSAGAARNEANKRVGDWWKSECLVPIQFFENGEFLTSYLFR